VRPGLTGDLRVRPRLHEWIGRRGEGALAELECSGLAALPVDDVGARQKCSSAQVSIRSVGELFEHVFAALEVAGEEQLLAELETPFVEQWVVWRRQLKRELLELRRCIRCAATPRASRGACHRSGCISVRPVAREREMPCALFRVGDLDCEHAVDVAAARM
jgi:hypothetical protein